MKKDLIIKTLIAEIKNEQNKLEKLYKNLIIQLEKSDLENIEEFSIRGFSSILHDYYSRLERIFIKLANDLNGGVPNGYHWHIRLLEQMAIDIEQIRPKLISSDNFSYVRDLLSFRHLFRNIYGFELEKEKVVDLINKLVKYHTQIVKDINKFLKFLKEC